MDVVLDDPERGLEAAYAVVRVEGDNKETVLSGPIVHRPSAQVEELVTEALKWAKGKIVNIYRDSAYLYYAIDIWPVGQEQDSG